MSKEQILINEQYKFINYFMWSIIFILSVYAVIGLVHDQIYPPIINSITITVMITVVTLINKTEYDFEKFSKRATFIFIFLAYFNIVFIWKYTQVVFVFYIISLIPISYIYNFKFAVYIATAFFLLMISMIILVHFYDILVIQNPTHSYIKTVNYSTIILALIMSLINIRCFMAMYKAKIELALIKDLEEKNSLHDKIEEKEDINSDLGNSDKFDDLYKEILDYFEKEKPWQDNKFNLNKLTMFLKSNVLYVSATLNQKGEKNFKAFVNEYRINQVKEAIKNGEHKKFTLKHLYLEAGFVNQSTFNRIFKQMEGISPQEYIEKVNNS